MIKGAVGFVAIFVAFGICCMELNARYNAYVNSVPPTWAKRLAKKYPEAMKDGVLTFQEINRWQQEREEIRLMGESQDQNSR